MARQFLTGLNLNKNELLNAKIQNLPTSQAPSSPVAGQIFFDTDLHQLKVWSGTTWLALAAGGNVQEAITAAIDALTTDDIEEGSSNLYYETGRAKSDAAALLTGATKTNIIITGDGNGLTITAENGVADSTTDDLEEGSSNLYFTDQRAIDAVGGSATSANEPNTVVKRDEFGNFAASQIDLSYTLTFPSGKIDSTESLVITANDNNDLLLSADNNVRIDAINGDINLYVDGTAYVNEDKIVTETATETLTNKTVDGVVIKNDVSFIDSSDTEYLTIDKGWTGATHITATTDDLSLRSVGGDIILYPGDDSGPTGKAYVHWGNDATSSHPEREITTAGNTQNLTNKTVADTLYFANGTDGASLIGASGDNLSIQSETGSIHLIADGQVYLGNSTASENVVATIGDLHSVASGLNVKLSVAYASTALVGLNGPETTLDGATLADGDRVLLKDQADATENGIYVYGITNGNFTRSTDQLIPDVGDYVFIEKGATQAARGFIVTSTTAGTGSDVVWTQFSAAGEYTAGTAIDISDAAISVKVAEYGGLVVDPGGNIGIQLATNGGLDIDGGLYVNTGTGLVLDGYNHVVLDSANGYGIRKYAEGNGDLTASGGQVTWTVTHNLGTRDVQVQVYDTDYDTVEVDVTRTTGNVVTLSWVSDDVSADSYRVVVVG